MSNTWNNNLNLVEAINVLLNNSQDHYILCNNHLAEFKNKVTPNITHLRELQSGLTGYCQQCYGDKTQDIKLNAAESYDVQVHLGDGNWEQGWSASGRGNRLIYITDGQVYLNTEEAIKRHGITEIYIEAQHRLYFDE